MTTLTDTFDRADSDSLGTASGGFSWTETTGDVDIVSNHAECGTALAGGEARAESDLSTAYQYVQASVITLPTVPVAEAVGLCTHFAAAARNYYVFYIRGDTNNYRLFRSDAGTYTQIGTTLTEAIPARPFTARIETDGSRNITGKINGTTKRTGTDTTYVANRRTGFYTTQLTAGQQTAIDDYEAGDVTTINPYGYRPLYFHGVGA